MRLFNIIQTSFENYDSTVRSYISKTLNSLGLDYTHNQIFGMIYDGVKGVIQNAMFYIEDALSEQNVFTVTRKKSLYSLAKISGYEPYYGSAASGTLIGTSIVVNNSLSTKKIFIKNGTQITNKATGINYILYLSTNNYVVNTLNSLIKHEFKIVQGYWKYNSYVANGFSFETINMESQDYFDKEYLDVYVDGKKWTQASSIYDMTTDSEEYVVTTGYNNTFDIIFGDGINGKKLNAGQSVKINYICHGGTIGNVLKSDQTNFVFNQNGYDINGNSVNINDYMTLRMNNCISGGSNPDSIATVKNMIGCNSRSLVLANEDNFRLFFKRFSFIGYSNVFIESNSLNIIATCLTNVYKNVSSITDYYNINEKELLLNDDQKNMISTTLDNSKRGFAGITIEFQDPIIRKFAIMCYVKVENEYDKESIKSEISNIISNYFIGLETETLFISKSDIIKEILDNVSNIKSLDICFISDAAEQCYAKGYYYKYEYKMINNKYQYVPVKVMYESGSTPCLDEMGNISLNSKLEFPLLHGGINYYPYKDNSISKSSIMLNDPIQFFFL